MAQFGIASIVLVAVWAPLVILIFASLYLGYKTGYWRIPLLFLLILGSLTVAFITMVIVMGFVIGWLLGI